MPSIIAADDQRYIKALSHPLRVRILGILEEQAASPIELSQVLDATLGTTSYHVRQLNELGLVELVRETPRRGAIEHHYRAKPRPGTDGAGWGNVSVIAKRSVIGVELTQTADVAARAAATTGFNSDHARLERHRLNLDAKGQEQLGKAVAKLVDAATKIAAASAKRIAAGCAGAPDTVLVAMTFDAVAAVGLQVGAPPREPRRSHRS